MGRPEQAVRSSGIEQVHLSGQVHRSFRPTFCLTTKSILFILCFLCDLL